MLLRVAKTDDEENEGPARRFMHSMPDVPRWAEDVYEGFHLIDRDGMSGALKFRSMLDVCEFLGITSRTEQGDVMNAWRSMDAARRERRDALKPGDPDG